MEVPENEGINQTQPKDSKKESKKPIIILEIQDDKFPPIIVSKDTMEYIVTGGEKGRLSHWGTFEGAMSDVSLRLFGNKLTKRAEEGRKDFASLVRLVEEHKVEMSEKFRL